MASVPIRTCTIADLKSAKIPDPETPSNIHRNKRLDEQIGRIVEAVANVIDKTEHGWNEQEMIRKYANIAGCTANVLQYEVNRKRYSGGQHG